MHKIKHNDITAHRKRRAIKQMKTKCVRDARWGDTPQECVTWWLNVLKLCTDKVSSILFIFHLQDIVHIIIRHRSVCLFAPIKHKTMCERSVYNCLYCESKSVLISLNRLDLCVWAITVHGFSQIRKYTHSWVNVAIGIRKRCSQIDPASSSSKKRCKSFL